MKRREWQYAGSTEVNAYYSQKVNGLFIPAAVPKILKNQSSIVALPSRCSRVLTFANVYQVLNKPFFSPEYDEARNYGSIGAVLGHEMTHGFDDQVSC